MKILSTTLFVFSTCMTTAVWAATPCGSRGTVDQRIADCNESSGEEGEFQLVSRTREGAEIYMGYHTGVIWSADLPGPVSFSGEDVEDICERNHPEFGGLDHLQWKLPPVERYIQALKFGIQSSLPGVGERDYWTSTSDGFYVQSRYIFEGSEEYKKDSHGKYTFRHLETDIGTAYVKCIVETL